MVQHAYGNHDVECLIVEWKLLSVVRREFGVRNVLLSLDQHLLGDINPVSLANARDEYLVGGACATADVEQR